MTDSLTARIEALEAFELTVLMRGWVNRLKNSCTPEERRLCVLRIVEIDAERTRRELADE